jgi:RNA polymerase sigma-70 factor (ECF subfamily)
MDPASSQSISALLASARAGDGQALNRLFEMCRNYVAVVAQTQVESWCRGKCDPSDLVQQTLLEAYRGFKAFEGATGPEWLSWLRGILRHNAIDFARRYAATEKRRVGREIRIGPLGEDSSSARCAEPLDDGASPSAELLAHERELMLTDALARLSPDHREAILLRNLQGLPFEEVAQRMGRSRPAVQMLWMRAIRNLQELLPQNQSSLARPGH